MCEPGVPSGSPPPSGRPRVSVAAPSATSSLPGAARGTGVVRGAAARGGGGGGSAGGRRGGGAPCGGGGGGGWSSGGGRGGSGPRGCGPDHIRDKPSLTQ